MLGHTLFRRLAEDSRFDVYATVRSKKEFEGWLPPSQSSKLLDNVDALRIEDLVKAFGLVKPDWVINCIGVIKQAPAIQDPLQTIEINALLPHRIALLCKAVGAQMIHISTDCVFDGMKGNYTERDLASATDLYGKSKYLGEVGYPHCVTLRTSIIGHELKGSYGLVEWFLEQQQSVPGYKNAIYSGFPTVELARVIADYVLPNSEIAGLYHVSSAPISKYELLKLVASQYGCGIEIIAEEQFQSDRSLDSSLFRSQTGYQPPPWPELVAVMHADYVQGPYPKES